MRLSVCTFGLFAAFTSVFAHREASVDAQEPLYGRTSGGCAFISPPRGETFSFEFTRTDAGIAGDDQGSYIHGQDGVESVLANGGARLYPFVPSAKAQRRTLIVDLSKSVEKGQTNYGTIRRADSNFRVLWRQDPAAKLIYSILDIPVGKTVESDRTEASVILDGRQHILRFGPGDNSICYSAATVDIHGSGTTRATVTRVTDAEWHVALPKGAQGRLWDLRNRPSETHKMFSLPEETNPPPPVDKGLYRADAEVKIRRLR